VDWEGRRRDAAPLKRVVDRLAPWQVTFSCTDKWAMSAAPILPDTLGQRKATRHAIARNHCRQRHWFGRLKRQSIMVSQVTEMVDVTMALCARFRVNGDGAAIVTRDMIT
jgi:insertion element IS1 protein InsB